MSHVSFELRAGEGHGQEAANHIPAGLRGHAFLDIAAWNPWPQYEQIKTRVLKPDRVNQNILAFTT